MNRRVGAFLATVIVVLVACDDDDASTQSSDSGATIGTAADVPPTLSSSGIALNEADWLAQYADEVEEAFDQADSVISVLAEGPTEAECQELQNTWDARDGEMNELVDLMPPEMESMGDAIFVAAGDVYIALAICVAGETGPPLQSQINLYETDRRTLTDQAQAFGWDL